MHNHKEPRKAAILRRFRCAIAAPLLLAGACSPLYVMRAGFEESQILLRRRPLEEVVSLADTPPETARKVQLVMRARQAAPTFGLRADGRFGSYSQVDRSVLVWVLSASPRTALRPVTWWFPIVGSVPYKGFFERSDAQAAAQHLELQGYDTAVRGSIAYSTLGWFDDPLLSTMLALDDIALVDTVFHELTHAAVWVPGSVEFNESLANFVGAQAAAEFFADVDATLSRTAEERWADERRFGAFIEQAAAELEQIYRRKEVSDDDILFDRRRALWVLGHRWAEVVRSMKTKRYSAEPPAINNATIVAQRIYLTGIPEFERLFAACSRSLPRFINIIQTLAKEPASRGDDPYQKLRRRSNCEIGHAGA